VNIVRVFLFTFPEELRKKYETFGIEASDENVNLVDFQREKSIHPQNASKY